MFENGMTLSDYRNKLIERWGYDDELAMEIAMMADALINEYGVEYADTILEAIENCRYVIAKEVGENNRRETIYDVLKREGMLPTIKKDKSVVDERALKDAQCHFAVQPKISFDGSTFQIKSVDRMIVLPSTYNVNNPDSVEKLTKATDALIKSQLNALAIEGDTLIIRTGLCERRETLSATAGEVTRTFQSEEGLGLEEGFTSYTALRVVRSEYCPTFDVQSDPIRNIGGTLLDGLGLKNVIREAQMTKDIETLRAYVDKYAQTDYEELRRDLDQLLALEYARKKALIDAEEAKRISGNMDELFGIIAPKMSTMCTNMRLEGVLDNVPTKSV